jgi:GNAT superfamily N-acetyltransferase
VTTTAAERVGALAPEERTVLAEGAEADFMDAFERGAPPEAQQELGMRQHRLGPVAVLAMAHDPTGGYWSKTLGFRADTPATDDVVTEALAFYRSNGDAVATFQVPPDAQPEDWPDTCARHGLVQGNTIVKLLRPADLDAAPASTDLRVGPAGPDDALAWGLAFCRGFGMPEHPALLQFFGAATRGNGFHPWAAWDGDRLVAGANLHVAGPAAAFCGAATLPEARGRGAQSVFMQRRIDAARELGAPWLSAETWKEGDGQHNPSLHNLRRAGFVDVYERPNWIWRASA